MSIINYYNSPTVINWNLDDNGKPVSILIQNEIKQVVGGKIPLEGLPDEQYRIQITGYVEINIKDKIDEPNKFKCDYTHGVLYFDQSKNGASININKYYSRGQFFIPASRIWTRLSEDGNVIETLEDSTSSILKYIEVVDKIPTDLYDGRIWLLIKYAEDIDANTLGQVATQSGNVSYGENNYMTDYVFIPREIISLTKVDFKLRTMGSSLHNTGNDIRVRLCRDTGFGLPNLNDVISTSFVSGNPSSNNTEFIATVKYADESNNFGHKIILSAKQRYHFVMDIPSGTGLSMYSGLVNDNGDSRYAQCNYDTSWSVIENNIPSLAVYKAIGV